MLRPLIFGSLLFWIGFFTSCHTRQQQTTNGKVSVEQLRAKALANFSKHIEEFNNYPDRPASDGPYNATNNKAFLTENAPLFFSSNDEVNKVYNYRWWMISKHLKEYQDTRDGDRYWVITEFFGPRPWASLSGAITCPAGHQFYDVRWLRDPKYLRSYAEYYMKGSAATLNQRENDNFLTYMSRPESHHFSSWMIDGIEAFLKVHPDRGWTEEMLPHMEQHQAVWDRLFRVNDPQAETAGLYKILDLYDGMEFSLSAVLGLIASQDAYQIYTEETWRDLYLGWETTDKAAMSEAAKKFPKAFRKGYPDFYLARPSVNSYAYGNLSALANLYALINQERSLSQFGTKSKHYQQKARQLQTKVLNTLWNDDDQFFNTYSAGDNTYGIQDYEARVRESVGYTPWYFGMIPQDTYEIYATAWDMFGSEEGFLNQMGMTTAERQHAYYNEQAYAWNGRGWPFQNSVVYKAYAHYLRDYKKTATAEEMQLLYDYIEKLTFMHDIEAPNIGEWYIPSDGRAFGGEKDYFHSTYPDIIIEDLIGLETFHEDKLVLHPLLPTGQWDYFYLGNINYHGRTIDLAWNNDWDTGQSGKQAKLHVWIDGKLVASAEDLNGRLEIHLEE
ncbi:MAG: MGH1-like glycoside hydrolase domain-containing protein [Sphingobacteriaceae bacterium]